MNRAELMDAMGLKDRMHFATAYLGPALESGVVEMTIPDKPRSSRQKYRITATSRNLVKMRETSGGDVD
jgi:ATP-dependent DNA helicase RecG